MIFGDAISKCDIYIRSTKRVIVDLGTGDGDVIKRVISHDNNTDKRTYLLVDPSDEYLHIAKLLTSKYAPKISYKCMSFKDIVFNENMLCLSVHMLYLLDDHEIAEVFKLPEKGVELIVICDDGESVFSELWTKFAKKYYERTLQIIKSFNIAKEKYDCCESYINTKVISPIKNDRIGEEVFSSMMSVMCYHDWRDMNDDDREIALAIIQGYIIDGYIQCRSRLIQINTNKNIIRLEEKTTGPCKD
jgi:ubiquinone/menaquinone biosynthesis C-methylase UbiE